MNYTYEAINKKLDELMSANEALPWAKPWASVFKPVNGFTGREYTRGNLLVLIMCQLFQNRTTGIWMTFNQVNDWNKKNGGSMHVRKGEHGAPVVIPIMRKNEDDDEMELVGATHRTVFNLDQMENVEWDKFLPYQQKFEAVTSMDTIFQTMPKPPTYVVGGAAYYSPKTDTITLPQSELFRSISSYYLTKAHETIHATGHEKRLARLSDDFTDGQAYSFEELVAELGAVYLCARAGLQMEQQDFDNSAAYLQGWKSALKENSDWFTKAAGQAVKAVDYILSEQEAKEIAA